MMWESLVLKGSLIALCIVAHTTQVTAGYSPAMGHFHTPTFRCRRCRRLKLRDGLRAWLMQPPMPTTGRGDSPGPIYYICRDCRPR